MDRMDMLKRFEPLWLLIVVLGALNWGMVGLFHENVLNDIFGSGTLLDAIYTVVGVVGLFFIPRLLGGLAHIGGRGAHPHGA